MLTLLSVSSRKEQISKYIIAGYLQFALKMVQNKIDNYVGTCVCVRTCIYLCVVRTDSK